MEAPPTAPPPVLGLSSKIECLDISHIWTLLDSDQVATIDLDDNGAI